MERDQRLLPRLRLVWSSQVNVHIHQWKYLVQYYVKLHRIVEIETGLYFFFYFGGQNPKDCYTELEMRPSVLELENMSE